MFADICVVPVRCGRQAGAGFDPFVRHVALPRLDRVRMPPCHDLFFLYEKVLVAHGALKPAVGIDNLYEFIAIPYCPLENVAYGPFEVR